MVVLKVENGDKDFFIGFNRQAGVNSGTMEAANEVTIVDQGDGYSPSTLQAKLSAGQKYTFQNAQTGVDIHILVNETNLESSPPYAKVEVYQEGCDPDKCIAGCGACCTTDEECVNELDCAIGTCNLDGTCSFDTSPCGESLLKMTLVTDRYPQETTWEITDDCNGGVVVMQGGPYDEQSTTEEAELLVNPSRSD